MTDGELVLYIIKLIINGVAAFTAVLLWSRARDAAWASISGGIAINYAGIIYSLLTDLHIVEVDRILLFGMPLTSLVFAVLSPALFITGILIMLFRNRY